MSAERRARIVSVAFVAAVAALGAATLPRLEITSEITHFLPSSEDRELARIAQEMASSDLNRTLTLTLEAPDRDRAIAASRVLAERLARRPEVEWVRRGPSDDLQQAFYELYFPRRNLFFARSADEAAARTSDAALTEVARDLQRRLVSPTGTFVRQIAARDPLLAFPRHLERLREAQEGGLSVVDGQLLTADERHGIVFLASRASPFDGEASRRLVAGIDEDFAAVQREHGPGLVLEQSGVHRFAVASEAAIREDVTRISTLGSLGVALLLIALFRSPRYLILGSVPLALGGVVGLAVTQLIFGRVHGLGLAFGATLIGVAIDYVAHFMNHHVLAPAPGGAIASLRRIWPGLALGAATTIAGLSGLAWTSFPGIRELAVFTSVGVLCALLATRYVLAPWLPSSPRPTRLHRRLAGGVERGLGLLRGSRALRVGLPLVALLVSVAGLSRLSWVDDVRVLNTLDVALLAEDERVRERVSRMDAGRFVMAWGPDEETSLQRNDAVHARLEAALEAGEVSRIRSLAALLPSTQTQRASLAGLRAAPELEARLARALAAQGFVPEAFASFGEALRGPAPPPLTWAEVRASPLGGMVSSFRVDLEDGRVAFVTMLRGGDGEALEARLAALPGVRLFDQSQFLADAYGRFRTRTLEMMGIGLVAVFVLLVVRYRRLVPAIAAFVPAVLAASTALAAIVLLGYQANLMHLVALLLVLSMGVDYGVFMVEARRHPASVGPTLTSLLVACLSTVLSFGLLAMSENPALRALGLITGLGVLFSLLLAPTAWLFVPEAERS
jgi:predicted exporter